MDTFDCKDVTAVKTELDQIKEREKDLKEERETLLKALRTLDPENSSGLLPRVEVMQF